MTLAEQLIGLGAGGGVVGCLFPERMALKLATASSIFVYVFLICSVVLRTFLGGGALVSLVLNFLVF